MLDLEISTLPATFIKSNRVEYFSLKAREYLLEPPSDRTPLPEPGTGGGREGRDGGRRVTISPYSSNSDRNDCNRRHSDNFIEILRITIMLIMVVSLWK